MSYFNHLLYLLTIFYEIMETLKVRNTIFVQFLHNYYIISSTFFRFLDCETNTKTYGQVKSNKMDSKLYYPSLTEVLKKTVLTLCEVNIQFDSSLEVVGSLHIKSDNQKVAAFMFDEQLIKNLQHREQPIHPNPDIPRLMIASNILNQNNPFLLSNNNHNLTSVAAAISNSLNAIAANNHNAAAAVTSNINTSTTTVKEHNSPNSFSLHQNNSRKASQGNGGLKVPHRRKATTPEPIRHVQDDYYGESPSPPEFTPVPRKPSIFQPEMEARYENPNILSHNHQMQQNMDLIEQSKLDRLKVSVGLKSPETPPSVTGLPIKQEPMEGKEPKQTMEEKAALEAAEIGSDNTLVVSSSESTQASPQQQQQQMVAENDSHSRAQEELMYQRQNWLMAGGATSPAAAAPMMHGLIGAVPPELMANLPWGPFQMSGDRYQCQFCGLRLKTKSNLESHMNSLHTRDKVYPCQICSRIFYSKGARNIHRLRNHRLKRHKCIHCGERFLVPSELRSHLEKKHKLLSEAPELHVSAVAAEQPPRLPEQDTQPKKEEQEVLVTALPSSVAVWANPDIATANMSIQNSQNFAVLNADHDVPANNMEASSSSSESQNEARVGGDNSDFPEMEVDGNLKRSVTNDESQNKHQCLDCGIMLRSKANLDSHINALHTRINKFPCEPCGKMFYSVGALRIHRLRKHVGGRRHACSYCDAAFALPCELKGHMIRYHPHEALPADDDSSGDYMHDNHEDEENDPSMVKAGAGHQEQDLQDLMLLAMNMAANSKKD